MAGPSVDRPLPAHVFLSYASEDRALAERVRDALRLHGLATTVWMDRHEIVGGDDWKAEIREGLLQCNVLVALLTSHSTDVERDRTWILYEHEEAARLHRTVVPLQFVPVIPPHLRDVQCVDFSDEQLGLAALRDAIVRSVGRDGEALAREVPPSSGRFIGREAELAEVVARLGPPTLQVTTAREAVALHGMGGVGKTALAHELVRRLTSRHPGGVLVETRGRPAQPASTTLQRWAGLARGRSSATEYAPAEVRNLLSAFGQLLVLIDDVAPDDVGEVATLLQALPADATRLITTRSLDVALDLGCRVHVVGGLSQTDAMSMLADRLRAKSRLDAPAFDAQFDAVRDVLATLVDRVDGHPLALDLAAGRIRYLHDAHLALEVFDAEMARAWSRLDNDDRATVGLGPRSVAACVRISLRDIDALDAAAGTDWRQRFADLGVFPEDAWMDRPLIEATWGVQPEDRAAAWLALDGLQAQAMVRLDERTGRYSLQPLLRACATALLARQPDRLRAHQHRYARYVIERATVAFEGPVREWLHWMGPYAAHLWAIGGILVQHVGKALGDIDAWSRPEAVPFAPVPPLNQADETAAELMLAYTLAVAPYVIRRPGLGKRGEQVLQAGLASARALGDRRGELVALRVLGGWHARRTPPAARPFFMAALDAARALGDQDEEATVLSYLGEVERACSHYDTALDLLGRALPSHRGNRSRRGRHMEARTLKYLGETYWRLARYDDAMARYSEALRLTEELDDEAMRGALLNKIGSVQFVRGEFELAIPFFEQALEIHRDMGDRANEAVDLNDLGITALYMERPGDAIATLSDALAIHRDVGNRRMEAITLSNLAAAHLACRTPNDALRLASEARDLAASIQDSLTTCWGRIHEGRARVGLGRPDVALQCFDEAIATLRSVNEPRVLAGALGWRAEVLGDHLGRTDEALAAAREGLQILTTSESKRAFAGRSIDEFEQMVARYDAASR